MKKNFFTLAILVSAFLTGCSDDDDDPKIEVPNKAELNQEAYADIENVGSVTFIAPATWTADVNETTTDNRALGINWLELDKYSGEAGQTTIFITLKPNFSGEKRTAEIIITSNGVTVTVKVEQSGVDKEGNVPIDPDATYTITLSDDGNGTAASDMKTAVAGTMVTITATPNNGYVFQKWSMESGGVIIIPATASPAMFSMPARNVEIKAEFITIREFYNIETVRIKAGTFSMGSPTNEYGHSNDEVQHTVKLSKDFNMCKYQITNTQYAEFLNANNIGDDGKGTVSYGNTSDVQIFVSAFRWSLMYDGEKWLPQAGYENHPVANVSWYGAKAFADWVGGSLPTEAQWEYACRAGTTTAYSYGNTANDNYMWNQYGVSGLTPAKVGSKLPNAWGLYDMHGNVLELCSDWYDENYGLSAAQLSGTVTNPSGPATGSDRVVRGGSFAHHATLARSAARMTNAPDDTIIYCGFRVVFDD